MRITGGSAKGRNVGLRKAFTQRGEGTDLRPTPAKVRKAIFDILGERVWESRFLDLYSGSGAVGIEALSRGAASVVFVEQDPVRAKIIRDMTERFGFGEKAKIVVDDVKSFLRKRSVVFDIIFADPPYGSPELDLILPEISLRGIGADHGIVILEHSSKKTMPLSDGSLELKKTYKYGDTSLSLYRIGADEKRGEE
ncbi:MAG: 16S rRNA (guanine(966)-N(2))-methyltransferase RsmD [Nitrospirales bacterium]|nr:16S rRNA (guanine(966)-N(2))-methyltransferase RsmD [Nitrospirales bacterium]